MLLAGCDLPKAWAEAPQWRILDISFSDGLPFLTAWHAWRRDPQRARLLHVVWVLAQPPSRAALLRLGDADESLAPLARELADQWQGLLPGFHRLTFEGGRVLLTLCIGDVQEMLRAQHFEADSIWFGGGDAVATEDPAPVDLSKAIARFARLGTTIACDRSSAPLRAALDQCGFALDRPTLDARNSTGGGSLRGRYAPSWTPRRRLPERPFATPGHCAVVGAGLAGAAVAASLARRGWRVTVLDAADAPAAGASGLPVGIMAPHVSPDDALLSRLTRAGIRMTWQQAQALLQKGEDWGATGVVERRDADDARLPAGWSSDGPNLSWHASPVQRTAAGLPEEAVALWHGQAGWVKPSRLVAAWLAQPGIEVRQRCRVGALQRDADGWALIDAQGQRLLAADRVVIAAGHESRAFAPTQPLQPVRGQVAWGRVGDLQALPAVPVNGDGHLIARVPHDAGAIWLSGATFDRDRADLAPAEADARANRAQLARLHPGAAALLAPAFDGGRVQAWVGVRCASADRRPLVGPMDMADPDGPWLCTALGSRGLSFAVLCAELLAAQWHAEPLALPAKLAAALGTARTAN